MKQKTEADRLEVIGDLLAMAIALADRLDPWLAATISYSIERVANMKAESNDCSQREQV